nr:uncharacterized protein LOC129438858 isoform X2 [Misgurnus anguillicaudatus]
MAVSWWSVDEIQTFLSLLTKERIQRELTGATRNERVFKEVAQLLVAHGYQRTHNQCREKLKKLRCHYRTIKDHNSRSASNKKTWKWFDQMDAIYGSRPRSDEREGAMDLDSFTAVLENTVKKEEASPPARPQTPTTPKTSIKLEHVSTDSSPTVDSLALSPSSDAITSQLVLALSPPARTPTPPRTSIKLKHASTGKKRKRSLHQKHLAVLREMQLADTQLLELRERHFQMMIDEAREMREQEAALRREESAQMAVFNQAFLNIMDKLVQVMSGQREQTKWTLHHQDHLDVLKEMQATDSQQQELNRAQRERHFQMEIDEARQMREQEAALRKEENAQMAASNQAFLGVMEKLVQAISGQREHNSVPE